MTSILVAAIVTSANVPGVAAQSLAASQEALSTRAIVFKEIEKLVPKYGVKVSVMGSSVKGNRYLDPLRKSVTNFSDVDMTLIVDGIDDQKELFLRWTRFHDELKANLRNSLQNLQRNSALQNQYGADLADDFMARIMDSVNVYPPDQLVAGVSTADEYVDEINKLFKEYGKSGPHLVNLGSDPFDAIIGGDSAKAFRQFYEKTHGIVFEQYGGKVIHGFHDLQEAAKFTGSGVTGISRQFLQKSRLYLQKGGHAKDLGKNLRRLNDYLKKAKSMAGLNAAARANPELDDLLRKLDGLINGRIDTMGPALALESGSKDWLGAYSDDIERALMKADIESITCRAIFETTDDAERVLLRKLIQHGKWQQFKNALARYYRGATTYVSPGAIIKGINLLAAGAEYFKIREMYATQGLSVAMAELSLDAVGFANLYFGLAKMAFEIAMGEAKEVGYTLAVTRQGCEDFLAGVVAVMGAEKIQKGYEVEEFARFYIHDDEAHKMLDYLAGQAAIRSDVQANSATLQTEAGKKAALLDKCAKPLMQRWLQQRNAWFREAATTAHLLRSVIEPLRLTLEVVSEEVGASGERILTIAIRPLGDPAQIYSELQRLRDDIKQLGGKEQIGELVVEEDYMWLLDGKRISPVGGDLNPRKILTLLDFGNDGLLGHRMTERIVIPDSKGHELELAYRQVFQSKASVAPEVMKNRETFTGRFRKKAVLPIEPPAQMLSISGPTEVVAGDAAGFVATSSETIKNPERLRWSKVQDGRREELGTGKTIQVRFEKAGKSIVQAEFPDSGAASSLQAKIEVVAFDPATVGFLLTDEDTGTKISRASVHLSANYPGGSSYSMSESDDLSAGMRIIPGPYFYRITASGYEEKLGNTVIGFNDTIELALAKSDEPPADSGTKQTAIPDPLAAYLGLTLDHRELPLEPGKKGYVKASAMASQVPFFRVVDVTADAKWESSDSSIVSVSGGVVEAGNATGEALITATFSPPGGGGAFTQTCRVIVVDLSKTPPEADFSIEPSARTYRPGQVLRFRQTVPPPHDDLEFHWYMDAQTFTGPEVSHAFSDEGKYTVALVVRSKVSGREQRFSRTVDVTAEEPPDLKIIGSSEPPYRAPANLSFRVTGDDLPANAQYRWLVDDRVLPSTEPSTGEIVLGKGSHEIVVFVDADGQELVESLEVTVGEDQAGGSNGSAGTQLMAKWRNRFAASPADENGRTEISSQYWREGYGVWSDVHTEKTIEINGQAHLETGLQADGINTGWLLYVPKGRNELRYEVLGFDFSAKHYKSVYSGPVPLHGRQIDPDTIKITNVQSRAIEFEWRSATGDFGQLRLYKTPAGGSVTGGLEELAFIEAGPGAGLPFGNKKLKDDGEFDEFGARDYAAGDHRKFIDLPQGVAWSAPAGERVFIHVSLENSLIFVKIKIKGSTDFGYVDEKGNYHDTRGKEVGYTDYVMKLGKGMYLMPVVPREDIEKVVGETVRFVPEYLFFAEGELTGIDASGSWSRTTDNSGISADGTRLPLETVDLSKIKLPANKGKTPEILEISWLNTTWYLRKSPDKLELRGSGYGSWGEGWIKVADKYESLTFVGTGKGPALAYKVDENRWRVVLFEHNTGKIMRDFYRNTPIRIGHGGQYGAYVFVGENGEEFYTVDAFNDRMRRYNPVTKEYLD